MLWPACGVYACRHVHWEPQLVGFLGGGSDLSSDAIAAGPPLRTGSQERTHGAHFARPSLRWAVTLGAGEPCRLHGCG